MAKTSRGGGQDRKGVAGGQEHELDYMEEQFGITSQQFFGEIGAVRNNRENVEGDLKAKSKNELLVEKDKRTASVSDSLISAELKDDVCRVYNSFKFKYLIKGFLFNRTLAPLITLRLCQSSASNKLLNMFFRLLHRRACNKAGIDLPWAVKMKGGVKLIHAWGMAINGQCVIGRNVTLFNGSTLGGVARTGCPTIEDSVWIGPNAVVVGGITIGEGSRIAAGAFVTTDIPPYSLVVGNPAKVKRNGITPDIPNPLI